MHERVDIVISGAGVAGLTAAAAFGAAGFSVLCVDPAPPVVEAAAQGADLRTTAFLQPARDFLAKSGLWERLAPHAMPLGIMRIVDAGGADGIPRATRDFVAQEIGDEAFGWNLPNWLLRREIAARLAEMDNVTFRPGVGFARMLTRDSEALVTLTDGTQIRAKLVIGADGRNSMVRKSQGIDVKTTRYGQKAVVFAVTHDHPHGAHSTEVHQSGGPFTLVPLPDLDGKPCSSVVWMDHGPAAEALMQLDDTAFSHAATARSAWVYGPLKLASKRQIWPIITQVAQRMTAQRTALVAEAAHVVPPIGAQGLNMSLADMACLLDLAQAAPADLGGPKMLDAYARTRESDVALRATGIDLLNRASIAGSAPAQAIRAAGVRLLHDITPIRRGLMKLGLGAK